MYVYSRWPAERLSTAILFHKYKRVAAENLFGGTIKVAVYRYESALISRNRLLSLKWLPLNSYVAQNSRQPEFRFPFIPARALFL